MNECEYAARATGDVQMVQSWQEEEIEKLRLLDARKTLSVVQEWCTSLFMGRPAVLLPGWWRFMMLSSKPW